MRDGSALALALVLALGCGGGERGAADRGDTSAGRGGPPPNTTIPPDDSSAGTDSTPPGASVRVAAVQVGAFADSARAARLADSLRTAGAPAWVSRATSTTGGAALWRVRVAVRAADPRDRATLVAVTRAALGPAARDAGDDDAPVSVAPVGLHWVNRAGTHGMASTIRWTFSPDRTRLVAVEDPVSVEAEPVPDGWLYAAETGSPAAIVGERSWDVAPSPDWRRLAAGVAFWASAGERDSLRTTQWDSLARASGLPVAEVRRSAFPVSGMAIAMGIARTAVWRLDAEAAPSRAPFGGGWQVGWTRAGELAVGLAPTQAQEMAGSDRWVVADSRTLAPRDTVRASPAERVAWVEGPTIDIGVPLDLRATTSIAIDGGAVEGRAGWISVRRGASRQAIGPGLALAASRGGRLVLALVTDPAPRRNETPVQLVVYRVAR